MATLPTTVNGTSAPVYDGIREGAAELALRRHGWTGERLMKEARRIVADYIRGNVPYLASHRRDELVDFVTEKALMAAMRFDPERTTKSYGSQGGKHFDSYICDVMWNRCTDWQRSKAEGNGDRRYNNDNRIFLAGDTLDDAPDSDVDFGELISERRLSGWQAAARLTEWTFEEFVVVTLDRASAEIKRSAAA
jgi:DNA-directed RNA polymerase specialized sigma24 family protein